MSKPTKKTFCSKLVVGALQNCLLQAFASICPVCANHFMVSAFILNFRGATPLDCKELNNLPRPPTGTLRIVRCPRGPVPCNPASRVPQCTQTPAAMLLRHKHVVPAAVLQTVDHHQPGGGWSMVALRQHELLCHPALDYSVSNGTPLPQLCHLLLLKSGNLAVQGRRDPPPQQTTLTFGLYADRYQLRGLLNINTKICIIDFAGDGNRPKKVALQPHICMGGATVL